MDDIVKSFKAHLYDRVTSPLLSSFLISWILWNHRLFVVLATSDLKVKEKFDYIDCILFPTVREILGRGIFWPLLSALALLFLYPFPARWVFRYVRNEQKHLKKIQQEIEDETPLTISEANKVRGDLRDAERKHDEQNKLIAELRSTITELDTQLKYVRAAEKNDGSSLNVRQRNMLAIIASRGDFPIGFFYQGTSAERVQIEHEMDKLVANGFVTEKNPPGDRRFDITPKGREFLFQHEPTLPRKFEDPSLANFEID